MSHLSGSGLACLLPSPQTPLQASSQARGPNWDQNAHRRGAGRGQEERERAGTGADGGWAEVVVHLRISFGYMWSGFGAGSIWGLGFLGLLGVRQV